MPANPAERRLIYVFLHFVDILSSEFFGSKSVICIRNSLHVTLQFITLINSVVVVILLGRPMFSPEREREAHS